jgi:hypothetical protein
MTPGPWQVFDRRPSINDFEVSCGDSDFNGGLIVASCVGPDMEANATAIAAVPDLVAALNGALGCRESGLVPGDGWFQSMEDALKKAGQL